MTTKKRALFLSLSVAAAIGVLAVGGTMAFASNPSPSPTGNLTTAVTEAQAAVQGSGDAKTTKECVQASQDVPDPASWRPGARIDTDAEHGFLVIRNDEYAAVCIIDKGEGTGIMGGVGTRHVYNKLTAGRPFDYLSSWNDETGSIHFGIATSDVTGVSLVGPDQSVTPTVLRNGTFLAKSKFPENSGQSTTNHIQAALTNGQHAEGPFRG